MKMTNEIINDFNEYCYKIQIEFNKCELTDTHLDGWTDIKLDNYRFGVVVGLIREHDVYIEKLLEYEYNDSDLLDMIKKMIEDDQTNEKKLYDKFGHPELYKKLNYDDLNAFNVLEWIKKYHNLILEPVKNKSENEQKSYLFLYLEYRQFLKVKERQIEVKQPNLENYNNHYGLIEIKDNISVMPEICNRLYDKIKNKTFICKIDKDFAKILYQLKEAGYIGKLSFRGKNEYIFDGYVAREPLCEEIAYGKKFLWDISELHNVTCLYNNELYNNKMWIKVTNTDMIFEELLDDELTQNDNYITNVVHFQYTKSNGEYRITHLDHEYIFYTIDEYMERRKRITKGHVRLKTFKVDNSNIPINYSCKVWQNSEIINEPFIYYVISLYFKDLTLIKEYFELVY